VQLAYKSGNARDAREIRHEAVILNRTLVPSSHNLCSADRAPVDKCVIYIVMHAQRLRPVQLTRECSPRLRSTGQTITSRISCGRSIQVSFRSPI
jgi:hypothetical protein